MWPRRPCFPSTKRHTARRKATGRLAWVSHGIRLAGERPSFTGTAGFSTIRCTSTLPPRPTCPRSSSYNVNRLSGDLRKSSIFDQLSLSQSSAHAGTQNVNAFPQHPKDPVATNWLFDIQQEVARNTILTLSYVGNNVHHMQAGVDFAALNANPANVFTQARQYPNFANENVLSDGLGSNYNSLQVKLIRKVGKLNLAGELHVVPRNRRYAQCFQPGL